jgi:uncharacterized protein YndB with AHSA1/START domain
VARNQTFIAAPPERVFEVLSDPESYHRWVVGSRAPERADPDFPAVGSRFRHGIAVGPFTLRDDTEVVAATPPHEVALRVWLRPIGAVDVRLRLLPEAGGTRVVLVEDPAWPPARLLLGPLGHGLLRLRNAEALRRLKALAEG